MRFYTIKVPKFLGSILKGVLNIFQKQ
ncbi:MAG TPA: stage V sporulation protein SpoVM [Firmicutes bacterium]|nr:stage V sporulation protein SpoVM [Bacillota bacterium]